jgi:hypothetical protein
VWAGLSLAACANEASPAPSSASSATPARAPHRREAPAGVRGAWVFGDLERVHALLAGSFDTGLLYGKTWPGSLVALLGLPLQVVAHVDVGAPLRGLSFEDGDAVGVPLRNPDALFAELAAGPSASYRRGTAGGVDTLTPLDGVPGPTVTLVRNTLVVATSEAVRQRAAIHLATPDADSFAPLANAAPFVGSFARSLLVAALERALASAGLAALASTLASELASSLPDPVRVSAAVHPTHVLVDLGLGAVSADAPRVERRLVERSGARGATLFTTTSTSGGSAAVATLAAALPPLAPDPRVPVQITVDTERSGRLVWARLSSTAPGELVAELERRGAERLVLTRIGDVYRTQIAALGAAVDLAVHVDGPAVTLGGGSDPLLAVTYSREAPSPALAEVVDAAVIQALPDALELVATIDVAPLGAPSERGEACPLLVGVLVGEAQRTLRLVAPPKAVARIGARR